VKKRAWFPILTAVVLLFVVNTSAFAQDPTLGAAEESQPEAVEETGSPPIEQNPEASYLGEGVDPENCLSCHKFRGLSRLDDETGELRLFFCSAEYYARRQGPHSRLRCTACHEAEEYKEIPHDPQTAVDCTKTCHLVPESGVALEFSHQAVADTLSRSAHADEALDELIWDRALLREGQSSCLFCHDQPVFREPSVLHRTHRGFDATARCDTCHGDDLPVQVDYYLDHVVSRMQPARPVVQLVQVCAVCHSDRALVDQMESHDAVASYLHSFHGKASLLGSQETATCVDCHAHESGNVHMMMGADEAHSSTHEARIGDTCRSADCHPSSAPGLSSAAVHLEIDPGARTIEFYVAAFFILLTAGVMSLYFFLLVLELFNSAFRPSSKEHHRMVRLARKVLADPEGRELLTRMDVHQRFQHWILAVFFLVLVLTGMPIKFAEAHWAEMIIDMVGGLSNARALHRISGVILVGWFVYHLGYIAVKGWPRLVDAVKQRSIKAMVQLVLDFPMMVLPRDVLHFIQLFLHLLFIRKERPHHPHFKFSEKFEYMAVFWGMGIIGCSGVVLWVGPLIAEWMPGWALNFAFIVHSDEAYLAFIYIAVVHMFTVILAPAVFPLSLGTLSGDAPAEEIAEGHLGELLDVAQRLNITVEDEPEHKLGVRGFLEGFMRRSYSLALLVVVAMVGASSMSFLGKMLLTRPAAPAEIREIPKVLDADMLLPEAHARERHEDQEAERQTRGPLAHFHKIPDWYMEDEQNSCTVSGCHTTLPHGDRIETRAFLNMHTTFVDCQACHVQAEREDAQITWVNLDDREARDAPALLRLADELERIQRDGYGDREATHALLHDLLEQAYQESNDDGELHEWVLELETTHPESRTWERLVKEILMGLPLHVHGEYGAKLGRFDKQGFPVGPDQEAQDATAQLLASAGELGEDEEQELLDRVHAQISEEGLLCTPCHALDDTVIDFAELGYAPSRIRDLESNAVIRQALNIEEGESFFLPTFLGDDDAE
jgi:thiosulfate reductase cytochrome b subunit